MWNEHLDMHSGELLIFSLAVLVLGTLIFVVPRLLRTHQHTMELQHKEHLKALEMGKDLPRRDDAAMAAGRTATLVPMVVICAAATVTCFLVAYKTDNIFAVVVCVWAVAGVVCLTAITGGVTLMTRLAHVMEEEEEQKSTSD